MEEKVIGIEESYQMLQKIFEHFKNDDVDSVKNIFNQYEGRQMGFVVN